MRLSIIILILATQAAGCASSSYRAYRPGERVAAQTKVRLTLNDRSEVVLSRAEITSQRVTGVAENGTQRSIPIEVVLHIQVARDTLGDTISVAEAIAAVFTLFALAVMSSGV